MNISNLEAFVDKENAYQKVFGKAQMSLLKAADRQAIADKIDSQLSPEWLTCDGELSRAEVNRRYNFLIRCARELRSIDPAVTFYEYSEEV
jgi:hypothetical protein